MSRVVALISRIYTVKAGFSRKNPMVFMRLRPCESGSFSCGELLLLTCRSGFCIIQIETGSRTNRQEFRETIGFRRSGDNGGATVGD